MRSYFAPVLCAVLMVGTSVIAGCASNSKREPMAAQATQPPPQQAALPLPRDSKMRAPKHVGVEVEQGVLKLPGPVVFETGSDKIRPESDAVLGVVADYLAVKTDVTLMRIEGHTDNLGSAAANQALSEKRAMAVARWLVSGNVDCTRLLPVGFGQTKPITGTIDRQTEEEQAKNRRISFVNAALKGTPIGGVQVDGGGRLAGDPCR